MKQISILDSGYEQHHKLPKWYLGKVPKICRSRIFLCPICHKKTFCRLCQWQMSRLSLLMWWFCFSFYWFFCWNVNTINNSMILHIIHVKFFASVFLPYTYLSFIPASFLFSIKLCESLSNMLIMFSKQMKIF